MYLCRTCRLGLVWDESKYKLPRFLSLIVLIHPLTSVNFVLSHISFIDKSIIMACPAKYISKPRILFFDMDVKILQILNECLISSSWIWKKGRFRPDVTATFSRSFYIIKKKKDFYWRCCQFASRYSVTPLFRVSFKYYSPENLTSQAIRKTGLRRLHFTSHLSRVRNVLQKTRKEILLSNGRE